MSKRKRERKLLIAPFTFLVQFDDHLLSKGDVTGIAMVDEERIYIDSSLPRMTELDSIFHEAMHCIWRQTWLNKKVPDGQADSLGERIISELTPRLVALIRDNPDLIADIQEAV